MSHRLMVVIILISVALVLIGAFALSERTSGNGLVRSRGTITYLDEGPLGIIGDDGWNYLPLDMPDEFKIDGLRVEFTANITYYKRYISADMASSHTWVIKLISIERLP